MIHVPTTVPIDVLNAHRKVRAVEHALSATSNESLAQAAFRTMRENCAPPHVLDIARRICAAGGMSTTTQWDAVYRCAEILDRHSHANADGKGDTT